MTTCMCGHDRTDHQSDGADVGCLHGWGVTKPRSARGCRCDGFTFPLPTSDATERPVTASVSDADAARVHPATPDARHAVYIQFDDPEREPWYHPHAVVVDNGDGTLTVTPGEHQALEIPALIPDPRVVTDVPF